MGIREMTVMLNTHLRFQLRLNTLTPPACAAQVEDMTSVDGRLGIELFHDEFVQDPYPLYERMLGRGPVHRIDYSGFYAVCSWDAISDAIVRPEHFSSNLTATMVYQPDGTVAAFEVGALGGQSQALATADDPAHGLHRKALIPQLAAKRIRAFEPFIAATADRLWNANMHDGHIEWMSAMANRLPMAIVGRIIGVPENDIDKLVRWGYAATQLVEGLVGYVTDQFEQAAANPQDNLLGDLAIACATGELADLTALAMMITLFSAGGESTASLIGSAALVLATRRDIQQQVRDQPELLGVFLEEVLRY
jgi:cytochrome P450